MRRHMPNPSITFYNTGDFSNTTRFFNNLLNRKYLNVLEEYGKIGVQLLSEATPKDTGKTARSWDYVIESNKTKSTLTFINHNLTKNNDNIALLIQYGHGLRNGGYVAPRNYINPVIEPLFDKLADEVFMEVRR